MLRLSTGDELNNLPMPTVEVEVYHEWWEFDTDTFPPLSLLTFPHHGGILSWWEYTGKPNQTWVQVLRFQTIKNQYNKDKAVKEEAPNLVREAKRDLQFDDSNVEDCKGVLLELGVTKYSADPNLDKRQI